MPIELTYQQIDNIYQAHKKDLSQEIKLNQSDSIKIFASLGHSEDEYFNKICASRYVNKTTQTTLNAEIDILLCEYYQYRFNIGRLIAKLFACDFSGLFAGKREAINANKFYEELKTASDFPLLFADTDLSNLAPLENYLQVASYGISNIEYHGNMLANKIGVLINMHFNK